MSFQQKRCLIVFVLLTLSTLLFYLYVPMPTVLFSKESFSLLRGCSSFDVTSCLPNPFYQQCIPGSKDDSMAPFYDAGRPKKIKDILVVIVFPFPLYQNLPAMEYMYHRVFENVLYCGPNRTMFNRYASGFTRPLDFVEVQHRNGEWGQRCMLAAVKTNFSGAGYLHMADDVLLNVWNLDRLPRNLPWFFNDVRNSSRKVGRVPCISRFNKYWWPWQSFMGKASLDHVWKEFHGVIANGSETQRRPVKTFLANLQAASGKEDWVYYYASDIWYLPSSKAAEFAGIMEVFDRHKTYLELAIPTVLHGLGLPVKKFPGAYLWGRDRPMYLQYFSPDQLFLHPFKQARDLPARNGTALMCEHFLPRLQQYLGAA